jgi:hypothetical protein
MDLHFPRERVRSVREFFLRYLLIVAGILTALAVNQWRDNRAGERLAAETEATIREELAANAKDLRESIQQTEKRLQEVRRINKALKEHKSIEEARTWLKQDTGGLINIQLSFPTLRHAAWNAGIASGAMRKMTAASVLKYSEAYAGLDSIRLVADQLVAGSLGQISATVGVLINNDGTLGDLRRGFLLVETVQDMLLQNQQELLKSIEDATGPVAPPAEDRSPRPAAETPSK